jgi:hypothetical protein
VRNKHSFDGIRWTLSIGPLTGQLSGVGTEPARAQSPASRQRRTPAKDATSRNPQNVAMTVATTPETFQIMKAPLLSKLLNLLVRTAGLEPAQEFPPEGF